MRLAEVTMSRRRCEQPFTSMEGSDDALTHEYRTDFRRALSSFTGRCSAGTAISRDGSRPPLPPLLPLVAGPLPSLPSYARTIADHRLRWG